MDVCIILDLSQAGKPSSSSGRQTVRDLKEWGVKIRTRKPKKAAYSLQHAKTWIIDEELLLVASMNATGNSVGNCEEVGIFLRTRREVEKAVGHFMKIWEDSSPVVAEMINLDRSRSVSKTRSPSRSRTNLDGLYETRQAKSP